MEIAQSENARLKKSVHRSAPAEHWNYLSNNQAVSDQNPLRNRNVYSRSEHKFDLNRYCSFHGFKVEESHTFATFRYLLIGHKKLATRLDTKGGKSWNKDWISFRPTEWGGAELDNDIVNNNENYINYINYNPKLVHTVDELAVADTGTAGHYLTLDSPCNNKKLAIILLPIRMPNG